jgi:hypothetical protein
MTQMPYNEGRMSERFFNAIGNSCDDRTLDDQDIVDKAEILAKSILAGAEDIVSEESVLLAQAQVKELFSSPSDDASEALRRNVYQVIEERIGTDVVSRQATAENRCLKLVLMGGHALVDDRTRHYLGQVSQCYLFGLDEQCVIMCRSVLEAAFLDKVPDSMCKKHDKKSDKKPRNAGWTYTLDRRIKTAKREGIEGLGDPIIRLANDIKNLANDLLHPDRDQPATIAQKELDLLMLKTITVVSALGKA